ncbi:MAG: tagaturonate epimerase family protein [Alkalispirochaeta sp.]
MMNGLVQLIENLQLLDDGVQQGLHRRLAALPPAESPRLGDGVVQIYLRSLVWREGVLFGVARFGIEAFSHRDEWVAEGARVLFAAAAARPADTALGGLRFAEQSTAHPWVATAEFSVENARALHDLFPWTKPISLRNRKTTIGMGDRLGIATPGHIRAARQFEVSPVLAQQSVRENDFIGRTYDDVVADASWSVFQEGYRDGYGADGDHLKNIPAIDVALAASMPMITLDLTEVMRPEVAEWRDDEIENGFRELDKTFRSRVETEYADQTFTLVSNIEISFTAIEAKRCAVMYGPALAFSREVNDHLDQATGGAYDLEISIDETTTPTLPAHHLFIARELHHRGVTVNSLAPRFIGDFQKAVDYIGDVAEFEQQFRVHCAIAQAHGNYKVSVHSGSDKFSVYPIVGRETGMRLHLKTSGTSWLEALKTIAIHEPDLYRRIHAFAISYYPTALTHYHITADFDAIAPLDGMSDRDLPKYLEDANARQMLHISYGGILNDKKLRRALYASLHHFEEEYAEIIREHFEKHIGLLGASRR